MGFLWLLSNKPVTTLKSTTLVPYHVQPMLLNVSAKRRKRLVGSGYAGGVPTRMLYAGALGGCGDRRG